MHGNRFSKRRQDMTCTFARVLVTLVALTQIPDAAAQALQIRDNAGSLVGLYLGGAGPDVVQGAPLTPTPGYRVASATGYVGVIDPLSGKLTYGSYAQPAFNAGTLQGSFLSFLTTDCTGQAYVKTSTQVATSPGGFVFATSGPSYLVYYVHKSDLSILRTTFSDLQNGTCNAGQNTDLPSFMAIPNDPAVSGFPDTPFAPPLTLGFVSIPWLMFGDGFETV